MNNKEIERKFLIDRSKLKDYSHFAFHRIEQGYVFDTEKGVLRIRRSGEVYFLTIKSRGTLERNEIEFEISGDEANVLLGMCDKRISKTRYKFLINDKVWEIDIFEDDLFGLVLAEVELDNIDEKITLPDFVCKEVTEDIRYQNSNLINFKYKELI